MEQHIYNVKTIVESLGYKIVDVEWYDNIYKWLSWYKGKVNEFHNYFIYNGRDYVYKTRYSMQMPKLIAEDWATLLYNDRTAIKVDESNQKKLEEILKDNKFDAKFSNLIEMIMALGIGATTEYKDAKGNPKMNFTIAPMVFPLRVEHGEIVDCAFASVTNDEYYINIHEKQENGDYKISNYYYTITTAGGATKKRSNKGFKKQKNDNVEESYISKEKMFQIFKPCIANNYDVFTPFGLSVYANAIDRVKACDLVYDSLRNEFVLGKKRLFLREDVVEFKDVVRADGTHIQVPTFDNNDVEFYSLDNDPDNKGEQIKEINPTLRINEHIDSLQSNLNMLSDACGLGNDRYNFKDGKTYVNTSQIISTNSKLYKTLLKHEKEIRASMIEMVKALLYIKNNSVYTGDVTIDFDDSIIEDTGAIQKRAMLELQSGIIDRTEYLVQVYKYTEEQASKFLQDIDKRILEERKRMAELEPTPEDGGNDDDDIEVDEKGNVVKKTIKKTSKKANKKDGEEE